MTVTESCCLKNLCLSEKVYVCHRQYVSVTDSLFLSQTVCFLSQTVCVSRRLFVFLTESFWSVSLCIYLLDHPWPDFYLFINDFHQDLSMRFQFVRDFRVQRLEMFIPSFCPALCSSHIDSQQVREQFIDGKSATCSEAGHQRHQQHAACSSSSSRSKLGQLFSPLHWRAAQNI